MHMLTGQFAGVMRNGAIPKRHSELPQSTMASSDAKGRHDGKAYSYGNGASESAARESLATEAGRLCTAGPLLCRRRPQPCHEKHPCGAPAICMEPLPLNQNTSCNILTD